MKPTHLTAMLLAGLILVGCGEQEAETDATPTAQTTQGEAAEPSADPQEQLVDLFERLPTTLQGVDDEASARKAADEIRQIAGQIAPRKDQVRQLGQVRMGTVERAMNDFQQQLTRLEQRPQLMAIVGPAARDFFTQTMPGDAAATRDRLLAGTRLKQVGLALSRYQVDNNKYPETLQALVDAGLLQADALDSPVGDASGGDFVYIKPEPDHAIIAYDRAALAAGQQPSVLFADGRVEQVSRAALQQQLQQQGDALVE